MSAIISFIKKQSPRQVDMFEAPSLDRLSDADANLLIESGNHLLIAGLHIALTTSALNYLDPFLDWRGGPQHFAFVPSELTVPSVAIEMLMLHGALPEMRNDWDLMLVRLSRAKRLLNRTSVWTEHLPSLQERDELVSSWSMTADAAQQALAGFETILPALDPDLHRRESPHLAYVCGVLAASRDGNKPCLRNGVPVLPDWAERRQARRVPLIVDARLRYKGRELRVRVRDAALGGLGIEQCGKLEIGAIVAIKLECGRRLLATVAWTHSDRAGLSLTTRLRPCDPLLSSS